MFAIYIKWDELGNPELLALRRIFLTSAYPKDQPHFTTITMKKALILLAICLSANVCLAQTSIQGRELDVRAFGAKCDGVTNDLTAISAAITAVASTGGIVNLPEGTCISNGTLSVPGGVTLRGKGKFATIIKSSTNAVILNLVQGSGSFAFFGPKVYDLAVDGSDSGSSQIGIQVTDATYVRDVVIEDVQVTDCGSHGVSFGLVFSSSFKNIYSSSHGGYPFFYNSPNMPSNYFYGLYAGDVSSAAPAGYRIKQGDFTCWSCNGINVVPATAYWAVIGGAAGDIDGDVTAFYASAKFTDCNIEGAPTAGVLVYPGSVPSFEGNTRFVGLLASSGSWSAILYDTDASLSPENARRGYIADTVIFSNSPASFFANSQPIRSDGLPPLSVVGRGPQIAGGGAAGLINTYYNTATSRAERLPRADGYAPTIDITTSTSFTNPGGRAYRVNCASPCTLTLPSPVYYENGNEVITVFNLSSTGTNVTIAANGGAAVNGSTYVLSVQGASVQLFPDVTSLDWRVVGNRIGAGSANYYPVFDSVNTITQSGSLIQNSTGSVLVSAPLLFSTDNTRDIGSASDVRPRTVYVGTSAIIPSIYNVSGGACYKSGSGTPEGSVTCEPGSIYLRTNGSWYIKSSGSGNTGWSLVNTSGVPSLTSTYIAYGDGSNNLTGTSTLTWNNTTRTLTATSAAAGIINLSTASTNSAFQLNGATHPGTAGGFVLPFVGGGNGDAPGLWWTSSASYSTTSGLFLSNGFNFQGATSTHDPVKINQATGTSSTGTTRYTFAPSSSLFTQNLSTASTGATHDAMQTDLTSSGGAGGANLGIGHLFRLENASSSLADATRLAVRWTTATGGAETARFVIANNNAGGGLADSFTVEGDQHYGTVNALGNKSGSFTIDFNDGNYVTATITGNWTTVTFSNIKAGGNYVLRITQNGTGGWTWTPPTSLKYPGGGGANILTLTANAVDLVYCYATDSTNLWCNILNDLKNP